MITNVLRIAALSAEYEEDRAVSVIDGRADNERHRLSVNYDPCSWIALNHSLLPLS